MQSKHPSDKKTESKENETSAEWAVDNTETSEGPKQDVIVSAGMISQIKARIDVINNCLIIIEANIGFLNDNAIKLFYPAKEECNELINFVNNQIEVMQAKLKDLQATDIPKEQQELEFIKSCEEIAELCHKKIDDTLKDQDPMGLAKFIHVLFVLVTT